MMLTSLACRCRPGLIGAGSILPKRTALWPCVFFMPWWRPAAGPTMGCQRIGTNAGSRRYSAGNCLPSAVSLGAS